MRLDKFLAQMEVGTRSEVKDYIKKGMVCVNGAIEKKSDIKIDEINDIITINGKELQYQQYYYYMLHKPAGVVTATRDNHDETVMDILKNVSGKDLFPVGRLDKDTEGLLLITNDGELSHNLLSPKKHVDKKYYVRCNGKINEDKVKQLEQGVDIGDEKITLPAKVNLLETDINQYTLELTITEGRFHQVKRMIQAIDGEVIYLKRLSFGALVLDPALESGQYRELTLDEINSLKNR